MGRAQAGLVGFLARGACFTAWGLLHLLLSSAAAQPSGGPYGPISTTYPLPEKAPHLYYVAPDGKADAAGTTLAAPTTIESALDRAVSGDVVVLRGGTYRTGGLELNQGITLQPYREERPVFKGTQVATKWQALPRSVWRTPWPTLFPARPLGWWQRDREGMKTPLHRFNNDMVFVDGEMLRSAGWEGELDRHSFYIDYAAGQVYIGVDPTNKLVEITASNSALVVTTRVVHGKAPDHKGPLIRGLTFTQYAYRALEVEGKRHFTVSDEPTDDPVGLADPSTFGKEVVGTTLENDVVSFCSRVGGYFRGDGLTIRNCLFSDTYTEGAYVIGSSDVLLERNIFRRNNVLELTGYYPAAVKIFNQTRRVTCRDNLVIEQPHSNGIWYDVGNVDGVFVNNWIEGAIDGFFFEISKGAICAGNVFVGCDKGVRVLNSSNVRVYHNTFFNCPASFERNERSSTGDHFGWHPSTGPAVGERHGHVFVGNLLYATDAYRSPLLRFEQAKALCGTLFEPQAKEVDANVYVRAGDAGVPLVVWSPVASESCQEELGSLEDVRKLGLGFETKGQYLSDLWGTLFRSPELSRYDLARRLPELTGTPLPPEILHLLGWTKEEALTPGAYPFHGQERSPREGREERP